MGKKDDGETVWIRLPYHRNIDNDIKKNYFKKAQKWLKENHKLLYNKENNICSAKDSIPIHQEANVMYKVICSICNEHGSRENQPMCQYL